MEAFCHAGGAHDGQAAALKVDSISSHGGTDLRSQYHTERQKHVVAGIRRMCDSSFDNFGLALTICFEVAANLSPEEWLTDCPGTRSEEHVVMNARKDIAEMLL